MRHVAHEAAAARESPVLARPPLSQPNRPAAAGFRAALAAQAALGG